MLIELYQLLTQSLQNIVSFAYYFTILGHLSYYSIQDNFTLGIYNFMVIAGLYVI